MASHRRVAHAGLASASLVLFTTLTILFRGGNAPVVGQEMPTTTTDARRGTAVAADGMHQTTVRVANVAVVQK